MVYTYAGHGDEALVEVIGVLGIPANDILLLVHALGQIGLTDIVVVEGSTKRKVMRLGEVGLEHQL